MYIQSYLIFIFLSSFIPSYLPYQSYYVLYFHYSSTLLYY